MESSSKVQSWQYDFPSYGCDDEDVVENERKHEINAEVEPLQNDTADKVTVVDI